MTVVVAVERFSGLPPEIDQIAFRNALGQFPTGVCVVTCQSADGEDLGMTMSSINSLSLDPPLVLFSIDNRATSLEKWKTAKGFTLNVLAEDQVDVSAQFARSRSDKWQDVVFDRGHGEAPVLREMTAHFECRPYAQHPGGDHTLFIVEVVHFEADTDRMPLVFCKGRYNSLKKE